uniref:Uncharacterized protein n=1 Tax=Arundo donax TaxID=35708 RepID=A0A0A8YP33_ARUDO
MTAVTQITTGCVC